MQFTQEHLKDSPTKNPLIARTPKPEVRTRSPSESYRDLMVEKVHNRKIRRIAKKNKKGFIPPQKSLYDKFG